MKKGKILCLLFTVLFLFFTLSSCLQIDISLNDSIKSSPETSSATLPESQDENSSVDSSVSESPDKSSTENNTPPALPEGSAFAVHFIDVGQADAALVLCDGKSMLIDGGNRADGDLIYTYLQKQSLSYLDYVVCTHPDEDHVGGLAAALTGAPAGEFCLLACSACELVLLDPGKFLGGCDCCCLSHRKLYFNLMRMLAEKNLCMIRKQYHMAQRTLRRKLASFLSEQSGLAHSRRFSVRMDRQELADYLGVDRSALCAELSRMKKEGLLDYHRHDFCLKDTLLEDTFEI